MKLFEVAKIGCFLDTIGHGTEKRRDDEVKIVSLSLRVQPFDAKLASTMGDGVRATLFKLSTADPKETLRRVDFALGTPRQNLHIFAAPDTAQPSIVLMQVKIFSPYARVQKDVNGFAFAFKASFGPVGRQELEFVCDWHLTQRFVTFEEAEPGMFADDDPDDGDEPDEPSDRPAPMFEGPLGAAPEGEEAAHRPLHSHQNRRGARKSASGTH